MTYIYTLYTYDCLKIRQFLDSLHCSDALGLGISTYLHLSAKKRKRSLQRTRGNNPHNQPEMEIMQDLWICEVWLVVVKQCIQDCGDFSKGHL